MNTLTMTRRKKDVAPNRQLEGVKILVSMESKSF